MFYSSFYLFVNPFYLFLIEILMSENLVINSTINMNAKNDVNIHCEIRYKYIILGGQSHTVVNKILPPMISGFKYSVVIVEI